MAPFDTSAYSRRKTSGGDGADGAAVVIFGQVGDKIGGLQMARVRAGLDTPSG